MLASCIYLVVSLLVFALKLSAALSSNSSALLSDALETLVNVAAAALSLMVMKFVSKPKDEDHPYGHGKAEFLSAAVEGGLIIFAGFAILLEAFKAFTSKQVVQFPDMALVAVILATVLNLALAFYLKKTSEAKNSAMLKASSAHILSDVWTTGAVLLALGVVKWTGWMWLDPVISACLAVYLFHEGYQILRDSFSGLTDELDPHILKEISRAFQLAHQPGLIDLHQVRFIRSGHFHHVDAHLVLPRFWDVSQAHIFMDRLESDMVKAYKFDGELAFHVDPCAPEDCPNCDLPNCPVRSSEFVRRKSFTPEELVGEKKKIE